MIRNMNVMEAGVYTGAVSLRPALNSEERLLVALLGLLRRERVVRRLLRDKASGRGMAKPKVADVSLSG